MHVRLLGELLEECKKLLGCRVTGGGSSAWQRGGGIAGRRRRGEGCKVYGRQRRSKVVLIDELGSLCMNLSKLLLDSKNNGRK